MYSWIERGRVKVVPEKITNAISAHHNLSVKASGE
jgi:hypothetical protein